MATQTIMSKTDETLDEYVLQAAKAAGLKCVVSVNGYTAGQDFSGAELVVSNLGDSGAASIDVLSNAHGLESLDYVRLS